MMEGFERGTVVRLAEDGRRFGFLQLTVGILEPRVFFHFSNSRGVKAGLNGPELTSGGWKPPSKGNVVWFKRKPANLARFDNDSAEIWFYEEDWKRADKEIVNRIPYRLMKQSGFFRGRRTDPFPIWEGWDLNDLKTKHRGVRLGRQEKNDGTGTFSCHWFERQNADGSWQRLPDSEDPRQMQKPVHV